MGKSNSEKSAADALAALSAAAPGMLPDLPAGAAAADLEERFLAELDFRRQRLQYWVRLFSEKAGYESDQARVVSARPRSPHRCKGPARPLS